MAGKADLDEMKDFTSRLGVDSFRHVIDDDGSLWSQFSVRSQPAFAFIDDDGTIDVHNGSLNAEGLTSRIEALRAQ